METSLQKLRLTLVTLGVADVAASAAFYERLGLVRSSDSNEGVAFFDVGGVTLAVFGREALAHDAEVDAEGSGFRGQSLAWNLGSPGEVDEAIARMVAAGARPVKAAAATFWGGYAGYVADPDGHLWELAHNPFWPLDGDGRMKPPA